MKSQWRESKGGSKSRALIDKSLKDDVVEVRRIGDRIILVNLVISDMVLNIISAYAAQVGYDESAQRLF